MFIGERIPGPCFANDAGASGVPEEPVKAPTNPSSTTGLIVADEARVAELARKLGLIPQYPFPKRIEPNIKAESTGTTSVEEGSEAARLGIKF